MQIAQSIKENITILHCAEMLGYHPVQRRGNKLSWTLKEHDSLVINLNSDGQQRFVWNSQRMYGSVIDFYMAMTATSSAQAIQALGNILKNKSIPAWDTIKKNEQQQYPSTENTPQELQLPNKSEQGYKRVFAYLCKTRGINSELVSELVRTQRVYQDIRGNAVFVGCNPKTNQAEYANVRGTLTDKQYRGDVSGSKKAVGFHFGLYTENPPTKLFVCEAPIDAMSVASILINHRWSIDKYGFLSLGGTATTALEFHLKQNPQIDTIYLCQDNDDAGNYSRLKAHEKLRELGFEGKIVDKPPTQKDFNEDLLKLRDLNRVIHQTNFQQVTQTHTLNISQ